MSGPAPEPMAARVTLVTPVTLGRALRHGDGVVNWLTRGWERGQPVAMTWLRRWLVADHPRGGSMVMAAVRVTLGLLWLSNLGWKIPPNFGQGTAGGLYLYVTDAVSHPVLPPYSWVIEHFVLPHFTAFGWATLALETLLAGLLLTGTLTRVAALVGMVQALAIGFSVLAAPGEWPWSYVLMVAAHAAVLVAAPATVPGVDSALLSQPGERTARASRQLLGWGAAAAAVGLWSAAGSVSDPFASAGTAPGISVLQLSFGQFNLLGALLMLALGAALVAAGARRRPGLALGAAVVAGLGALSVVARWGFGSVPLGANGSSTGLLLALVLVAGVLGQAMRSDATRGGGSAPAATAPRTGASVRD